MCPEKSSATEVENKELGSPSVGGGDARNTCPEKSSATEVENKEQESPSVGGGDAQNTGNPDVCGHSRKD